MDFQHIPTVSNANSIQQQLLACNAEAAAYGLCLSQTDAAMLAEAEQTACHTQNRVLFGDSAAVQLAKTFCKSSYLAQEDYAESLAALLDVFYEAKEASCDLLSDSEVIALMFAFFEHESGGSIQLLQERDMETLCRQIRCRAMGLQEEDDG